MTDKVQGSDANPAETEQPAGEIEDRWLRAEWLRLAFRHNPVTLANLLAAEFTDTQLLQVAMDMERASG